MAEENERPIIIKKIKKGGHGHHGGAWKIAYADFVTAMMAFFMLLWLLGNTTEEQKQGIADYFSPVSVSASNSGSGQILGGRSIEDGGAMSTSASIMVPIEDTTTLPPGAGDEGEKDKKEGAEEQSEEEEAETELANQEENRFQAAEEELEEVISDLPSLAGISQHLVVDYTPEGMRIQVIDRDDRSMFQVGGKEPLAHTKEVLRTIAGVISKMPNRIKVSGHTDSSGRGAQIAYGNWELSSDRAQASRRVLNEAGLPHNRIFEVTGKADTEPFDPFDPRAAANRRITIILMREAPVLPPNYRN